MISPYPSITLSHTHGKGKEERKKIEKRQERGVGPSWPLGQFIRLVYIYVCMRVREVREREKGQEWDGHKTLFIYICKERKERSQKEGKEPSDERKLGVSDSGETEEKGRKKNRRWRDIYFLNI